MQKIGWLSFMLMACVVAMHAQNTVEPVARVVRFGWSHFQSGNLSLETGAAKAGDTRPDYGGKNDTQLEVLKEHSPENKEDRKSVV